MQLVSGISVQAVTDDVLQAHEGGKIHMKGRMEIRSLGDLRRVYTPGVANVCEMIKNDPDQASYFTGYFKYSCDCNRWNGYTRA